MLLTLPLVLFIVMTELSIGAFSVLFLFDWRNGVKRAFLVLYALIYLGLTGLTFLFQQNFSTPDLLNSYTQLDKTWTAYLPVTLLLFWLLMIPYNLLLWLDRNAGVDGKERKAKAAAEAESKGEQIQSSGSPLRLLRLISGGLVVLAGLATLFVLAMIYRPLASANLGGVFTVAGFFAAALALGGVMTAMWLGHWYLVTPALSERPYLFATTLVLLGVLTQVIFAITAGPSTTYANKPSSPATIATATPADTISAATPTTKPLVKPANVPVITPLSIDAIGWLRILLSFVLPLTFGSISLKLIRDRSFQSATGMLYLVVVSTLAGEAIARGLFLMGL